MSESHEDQFTWDYLPEGPIRDERQKQYNYESLEEDNPVVTRLVGQLDDALGSPMGAQEYRTADGLKVNRWSEVFADPMPDPDEPDPKNSDFARVYVGIEHRAFDAAPIEQYSVRMIMYGVNDRNQFEWSTETTYDLQFGPGAFMARTDRMLGGTEDDPMPVISKGHGATEGDLALLSRELEWLIGNNKDDD